MKTVVYLLSAIAVLGLVIVPSRAGADPGTNLTAQLAAVCFDIHQIQPGMTRADLARIFRADTGGIAWPESKPLPFQSHQSFIYRNCPLIKVDVEFAPSDAKMAQPTDIITTISRPYLDDSPKS
jgi:hypothetical protein